MAELAALPTTRDEAWRYADSAALTALSPDALSWKEISLADGETRVKSLILGEGEEGVHRIRLHLGKGARAEIYALVSSDRYTRLEIEAHLEEAAHFELGGVTIGGGAATREIVTLVCHAMPNATSNQTVRAVHWGQATGNFLGRLEVARNAQKTDAAQNFRAILLEKGASANAKPELEIFADDVKCAHGAAIGALDEAAGFYLASRGLVPDAVKRLLVQAFLADAFAGAEDEALRDNMLAAALAPLEGAA